MGVTLVILLFAVGTVGSIGLLLGWLCGAWWLFAVRTFGAPPLDLWSGLGLLLLLLPVGIWAFLPDRKD